MYIKISLISTNFSGDSINNYLFFNYSNYCSLTYLFSFFIEFFLIIYVIYNFVFFQESRINFKSFFFEYIFFLLFLIFMLYFCLIECNSFSLISFHLLNNRYILYSKLFIILLVILILLISKSKLLLHPKDLSFNELPSIFSFLLLFICILLSSFDFFVIYLTIEGISLIVYTLGSLLNKSLLNLEAIIKYFLINNMASSILLWSISYIYILTGTTDCFELQYILISSLESLILENLYYICFILLLSLFFKLALFPFQWWVADIYEGLWTPITLCYAVLIKVTFFLFFFKLILNTFNSIIFLFQPFLWVSALGCITLGSLAALIQVKIKRFLAYTSIAQSGYIILGLSCNSLNGSISALLYLVMYCFITLSFFCILLNIEHIHKGHNITYLNQLYTLFLYNKEIAIHCIFIMLIMAALPPFSSFFAKFLIFIISIEAKLEIITILFLALTLISTFYYLNFIQQLIFFKFNETKIFKYNENNIFLFYFLRTNLFIFSFSFLILSYIYELGWVFLLSCLWPLTY